LIKAVAAGAQSISRTTETRNAAAFLILQSQSLGSARSRAHGQARHQSEMEYFEHFGTLTDN
jgi:hypothetical protein